MSIRFAADSWRTSSGPRCSTSQLFFTTSRKAAAAITPSSAPRDARRFCRRHHLAREDTELVTWLVRDHLVMSLTAQKQDLADPEVVGRFARQRWHTAPARGALSAYRGRYPRHQPKGLERLEGETAGRLVLGNRARPRRRRLRDRLDALRGARRRRWRSCACMPSAMARRTHSGPSSIPPTSCATILRRSRGIRASFSFASNTHEPVVKARLSPAGEGLQVMIYTPDQKDLFARICSFFERMSYNIVEAKIYTTRHGYALDSFQVLDAEQQHDPLPRRDQHHRA